MDSYHPRLLGTQNSSIRVYPLSRVQFRHRIKDKPSTLKCCSRDLKSDLLLAGHYIVINNNTRLNVLGSLQ